MDEHLEMTQQSEERIYKSDERMDVVMNDRQLACIEYPGVVHNSNKALHTLGGIKAVNKSINDETKRLEIRFRPDDIYCKPACGTLQKTAGVLLRVRRRKKTSMKQPSQEGAVTVEEHGVADNTLGDGYDYTVDILGTVASVIKFEGMCDFQYLPVARKTDGSYDNLLEKLVMRTFTPEEEYMGREAPLFLSPTVFSRFEMPQDYGFLLKKRRKDTLAVTQPSQILAAGRKTRQKYTTIVSFTDPTPQQASDECKAHAHKYKDFGIMEALQELFEERPIWSRMALAYRLRHIPKASHHLKDVLPAVAYFFLTGPWRTFWVKMGYDPRQDPSAKKFQGVDFRRQRDPEETLKERGRGKKKDYHRRKDFTSEIDLTLLREDDNPELEDSKTPKLRDFEFHADVLPSYRQVIYMVCDIFDAEVQALVSKNDGKEKTCDERNGWCVANFTDRCRSVMTQHVNKLCPYQHPMTTHQKKMKREIKKAQQLSDMEEADMDTAPSGDQTQKSSASATKHS